MAMDEKNHELVNHTTKLGFFAFFYAVFVLLLMAGHEGWLMYEHYQLLESFGINPSPQTYIDGMPTFVPLMLMALLTLIAACCFLYLKEEDDKKCETCIGMVVFIIVASAALTVLTYTIQIIVYLIKDVRYYLASLPLTAQCHCHNETDPLLYNISQQLYTCTCVLPLEQCTQTLVTADMNLLDDSVLKGKGMSYSGEVITQYHNSSDLIDAALDFSSSEVSMMFVLTQISIVIIVIRFPLWIAFQEMIVLEKQVKKQKELAAETRASAKDAPSPLHHLKRNVQFAVQRNNIQKEFTARRKINVHFVMGLCFYGFIEGVDSFSLLDEFRENGGYFAANKALTDTVLAFISINLLVVNLFNMLACIPDQAERINHGTKITLILISNVPFLIIRSYLFWLFGGLRNSGLRGIFLLFVIKEATVVLLGCIEVAVEVYHDREEQTNKPEN